MTGPAESTAVRTPGDVGAASVVTVRAVSWVLPGDAAVWGAAGCAEGVGT
jgi:hypothetical protein